MKQPRPQFLLATSIVIIALGIALPLALTHHSNGGAAVKPQAITAALWRSYKQHYWHSGQTVDPANNGITTSEAQSYTMLRAVWTDDHATFDATWAWTAQHLQRSDHLFAWKWGKQPDGTSGILTAQGGNNTASDADTDIALSLLMAGNRWHDARYTQVAQAIIPAIWEQEVVTINGQPYLTADQLEQNSDTPVLNPSYFAPYAYRAFAGLDTAHPWPQLVTSSYQVLLAASQQQLGSPNSANLPPDWVKINRQTGQLSADITPGHDTNFGYDALRAVWRSALDYAWNNSSEAKNALTSFSRLTDVWNRNHQLSAIYRHDGTPAANYSSIAMYGGTLGYYQFIQPALATAIYDSQFAPLYSSKTGQLTQTLNYYDNNWAWFGLALYSQQLPQLVKPEGL